MKMEQVTRFLCFALCTFVVTCKSKHEEKTWQAVNDDNIVTITLYNRQHIQSYANFPSYESGLYYNRNYFETQFYRFMENLFSNIQGDLLSRISPQNLFPYYFIIPKFFNRSNGFHYIPKNPNVFQTPTVPTTSKTPNKVEQLSTRRPQISGTRPIPNIPTLRSNTIVTQDTPTPSTLPETKISTTTNVNTESPKTTTVEPQEVSTTQAQEDDKGQFFDDEDDTTRPIILRDTKSLKSDSRLDKKLRKMPEVEHGSVQAGI
ncbi:uncharacterized protein LOC106720301 isoform X2 [Papilio machaon]|uniref:uncharacterized protein LOC106720301 isoform X2 n=1 Tax=Papilio machaon TaxID=76193 RepID=UPI001E6629AF|nr:uncharacterized protein LOC106720301 isoform X2 [Papilio machaon]